MYDESVSWKLCQNCTLVPELPGGDRMGTISSGRASEVQRCVPQRRLAASLSAWLTGLLGIVSGDRLLLSIRERGSRD